MNDPQIPLQVRAPEIASPMQTVGSLMQLRQGMTRQMMEQAQTEEARARTEAVQAQAEQRQRDLADENTIQAAQKDPVIASAFGNGDFSGIAGKIQPKALNLLRVQHQELVKNAAIQAETDLKLNGEKHGRIADTIAGLKQLAEGGDEGEAAAIAAYPGAIQGLIGDKVLNQGTFPPTIKSIQDLDALAATNNVYAGVNAKAQALKKEQAATHASEAEANLREAETPKAKAESEKAALVTQAMKDALADPTKGAAAIKLALGGADPAAEQGYTAAWQAAMAAGNPEAAAKVVEAAAAHATSLSPATRAAKVKTAVEEAQATAPIHTATAIATAKALRAGDNPAVAGVPPGEVGAVQNKAMALDAAALEAKRSTEALGKVLDLAESGNEAAGANVATLGAQTMNALNGIKRMGGVEQYGQAGSLIQKAEGKVENWISGKSKLNEVLPAIRELHQELGEQSYQKYLDGLKALNDRTGSTYQPRVDKPNIRKTSAPLQSLHSNSAGHTIGWDGKAWVDARTRQPVQ